MDHPEGDVELLVHITAPATTASDEDYRQLARAAVNFVPSKTTKLSETEGSAVSSSADVVADSFSEELKQDGTVQASPVKCTLPAGMAPREVGDTHPGSRVASDSDAGPAPGTIVGEVIEENSYRGVVSGSQEDENSNDSIIEEVPDSYPVGDVTLDPFASPTRMLEHHLRRIKSAPRSPKRALDHEESQDRPDNIAWSSQKAAKTRFQQTPRVPSSPAQDGTPDPLPMIAVDTNTIVDSAPIYESPVDAGNRVETITSTSQAPATSIRSGESKRETHDTTNGKTLPDAPLRRHQSDHGAKTDAHLTAPALPRSMSAPSETISPEVLESYKKRFSALEVFPPEPQASVDNLDESSFLTPHLRNLAKDVPLEKVYCPRFHPSKAGGPAEKTDLRPLQRGYWLLDMSTWDESSRWTAWSRLHGHISHGTAGWRVWCLRDEACVRIRTYCWASLAGHVYLLLNDASGGRVSCMDVNWIGDDGKPRISVPASTGRGAGTV